MQFVSRYIDWEESKIPFPCLQMICLSNPSKKKHLPNFPPQKKKTAKTCVSQLTFRSLFQPKKHQKKIPKNSQGLDAWEKSLVESHRRYGWWYLETRKGVWPLISESEKKKRRWIFWFLSWIQSRYSYWKSEGSFTFYALFGEFLLTPPQNWGEMMNVFQMGWRNEARVFL